ncbi:diacylglycerol kinase family protein [Colwellia ponticola]|uniref:Dual specificity protein phosphatase family protein n=1 Tax=Colwellia ponticola TaxID=2304625 RepID=A0A8H2JJ74_9GAMM|nr:diacylglycerol kinase family protein [Colwellia ponticola]TMM42501.1 hypothetical protein FCS21_14235 [Colwellia ponticola]
MPITYYYLAGACLSFAAAIYSPGYYYTLIFFWIASSFSLVSAAYLLKNPYIFRKKQDGTIPVYIRWLFIPFLLGAQLYNAWARKNDSVQAIQKIEDNLFLACRLFPSDMVELKESGVHAILDVTAEFDGLDWSANGENLSYLSLPVLDHQSPTNQQLVQAINWVDMHVEQHGVVIHCALGRGRSVFFMAAYLLSKNKHWTIEQALEAIYGVRKTAGLNRQQLKALVKAHKSGILVTKARLALIANPVSGGGKWPEAKDDITQRLSAKYAVSIYETTAEISAKTLAEKALKQGHTILVGCGGDGTIAEVAAVLTHRRLATNSADKKATNGDLTLGIIPLGTTNALSHVLHGAGTKVFPISVCCDVILEGKTSVIDTATCNDELFLLIASVGLSQKMIESADREEKNAGGQLAYLKGLWDALCLNEAITLTITLDEQPPFTVTTTSFVVANAAPFSTILAQGGGGPDIADGLLDITWLPDETIATEQALNLTGLAASGLIGNVVEVAPNDTIEFRQGKSIMIEATSPLSYVIDGESREADKIFITIEPSSLTVLS